MANISKFLKDFIATLGTAAYENVGTSADNILKLDTNGRIPAVSGELLTNLPTGSNYIGDMKYSAQSSNHGFWLLCQGGAVSRTTYSSLFAIIGTSFGAGDGSTTFNLPDFRGRVAGCIGQGSGLTNRTLGQSIGEENHTLTIAEMPSHKHDIQANASNGYAGTGTIYSSLAGINYVNTSNIQNTGGGASHNNMQPTLFAGNTFIYAGV